MKAKLFLISLMSMYLVSFSQGAFGLGSERRDVNDPASPVVNGKPDAPVENPFAANAENSQENPAKKYLDELLAEYEKRGRVILKPFAEDYIKKLAEKEKEFVDKREYEKAALAQKESAYVMAQYIDKDLEVPEQPDLKEVKELKELQSGFFGSSYAALRALTTSFVEKLNADALNYGKGKDYDSARMFQETAVRVRKSGASWIFFNNQPAPESLLGTWKSSASSREFLENGEVIMRNFSTGAKETRYWKKDGNVFIEYSSDKKTPFYTIRMKGGSSIVYQNIQKPQNPPETFTRVK